MKSIKINLMFFIIFSCVFNVYGQVGLNKLAQSTMNFLLVSVSPKASAMGDAYFAVSKGSESIFYNPAGIVETSSTFDATVNYTQWIADITYLGGAIAYNLGNVGTFGISVLSVDYGTINGTSLIHPSQQFEYPAGYIENGPISNVGAYSFGISYGKAISDRFSIGGNARLVGQNLGDNKYFDGSSSDNNATKLVFDAGVKYNTLYKDFRFGMAIRNFSSQIKREEIDEQLPLTFTLGAAMNVIDFILPSMSDENELTIAVDYLHSNNYSERVNAGLEFVFMDMVSVRGGYQTNRDLASFSGGLGLSKQFGEYGVELNYSYSQMEIFDNVNRLSIGFTF